MLNFKSMQMAKIEKKLHKVEAYLNDYLRFEQKDISESALYVLRSGGKRLRPAFVLMSASYFDNDDVIELAAAVELIHMASLIHDDIIDCSDTRRGRATLNVRYGKRYALHCGNYILAKALELVNTVHNSNAIMHILAKLSIEMCRGEIEQLNSVFDPYQTIEDYNYRIDRKTALLIAVCCQVGAIASDASDELVEKFYDFGYHLGMAFQIKDDVLDMAQSKAKIGKPAGSDLAHGILTLPTILTLKQDFPQKAELIQLIASRFPKGQQQVDYAIELIKAQGGLRDAMKIADDYIAYAKDIIKTMPDHIIKDVLLSSADFVSERAF